RRPARAEKGKSRRRGGPGGAAFPARRGGLDTNRVFVQTTLLYKVIASLPRTSPSGRSDAHRLCDNKYFERTGYPAGRGRPAGRDRGGVVGSLPRRGGPPEAGPLGGRRGGGPRGAGLRRRLAAGVAAGRDVRRPAPPRRRGAPRGAGRRPGLPGRRRP